MQRENSIWLCCTVFSSGDPKGTHATVSHKEWVMFADLLWEFSFANVSGSALQG